MLWMRSACASQCCWRSVFFLSFSSGESVSSRSISVNSLIRSGKTNEFGSSGLRKLRPCSERSDSFDFSSMVKNNSSLSANSSSLRVSWKKESSALSMARRLSGSSILLKFLDRFARYAVAKHVLLPHQLLDERLPFVVLMSGNRSRPADDEGRPRFVDENGIDFVDDRIAIAPLYLLFARRGHAVVAQIIEAELAVRAVSDVHRVLLATQIGFLIVFNAANC